MTLLVLLLAGCGGVGPLDGSLGDLLDLGYTKSTLELTDASLALRFLKARGEHWDTVLKVSVNVSDGAVRAGSSFDLAEELASSGQRGRVTRNVYQDDHTAFPALLRGSLVVKSDPTTAATVQGEVSVSFVQGSDFASGRAVFGPFAAEVVVP